MPRLSKDDWDTPGGPGGREALAQVSSLSPGSARALLAAWRLAAAEVTDRAVYKSTVKPAEFNAFRRTRLDAGITDEQLAASFEMFITAVRFGGASVRHNDLWRAYAASWARWVAQAPAPATRPPEGRTRPSNWQR